MKQNALKKTWDRISSENQFFKFISFFLSLALVMSIMGWLQTRETVILIPPHLNEKVWVSSKSASDGYKKAWGLAVAQLVGNVSPGNADFVVNVMGEILNPKAYRRIKDTLIQQAADIKEGALTITFEPQSLTYEKESNKVFVAGKTIAEGPNKVTETTLRTFEFTIEMNFGSPDVTHFDVYEGQAKTIKWLNTHKSKNRNQLSGY